MPVLNSFSLIANRVEAIADFHTATGQPRAELDVSGGVDSAVMLGLLSRALGPENVTAIWIGIHSSPDSLLRAREAAQVFGVNLIEYDASDLFEQLVDTLEAALADDAAVHRRTLADPTIYGSIRSTLRAPIGRAANRLSGGGIRHGTGNEDEDRVLRFYQKGGDGEVDTNPIAMLSKGEVFQLARALGVPTSILRARPSPDLWGEETEHTDEDEIKSYLGLQAYSGTMYSYVGDDGAYTHVGLVERLSRFCDTPLTSVVGNLRSYGDALFLDDASERGIDFLVSCHASNPALRGVGEDLTRKLLTAARRIEAQTRHKMNPAIPMLGSRADLLRANILTDILPVLP